MTSATSSRTPARLAGTIAARNQQLGTLLHGFNQTMGAFADQQDNLKATFADLNQTLSVANPTLTELDRALGPLRQFAIDIRPALVQAPSVLDDATPLLNAASRLFAPDVAPVLLRELGPAVSSLNLLEQKLPALLELIKPVARCVQDKVVPVLDEPVNDGKLSTGQPVWQELVRYPVGLDELGARTSRATGTASGTASGSPSSSSGRTSARPTICSSSARRRSSAPGPRTCPARSLRWSRTRTASPSR